MAADGWGKTPGSSLLCSAERERAGLTGRQSEPPRGTGSGDDSSFASSLSAICLFVCACHSITCVQPHADLSPPACSRCLSSTKQVGGGERKKRGPASPAANAPPNTHTHTCMYVLISSDSNHCLLAHFALVMFKSSSHILE